MNRCDGTFRPSPAILLRRCAIGAFRRYATRASELFERLVPAEFRDPFGPGFVRARLLLALTGAWMLLCLWSTSYQLLMGNRFFALCALGSFCITTLAPLLLLRTRSLAIAGNALAAAPFLGLTLVNLASSGRAVASLLMLPFLLLVPALVSGRRSAVFWTALICAELGVAWWARSAGLPAWIEPNPAGAEAAVFRAPILGALLLLAGVAAYESVTERGYRQSGVHRRLERARQRWRSLLEISPDGICTTHAGRIDYANSTLCNLLGWKGADDLRGRPLDELFEGPLPEAQRDDPRLAGSQRPVSPAELQLRCADGTTRSVEVSIAALRANGAGELLLVVRDLTKRKQLEEQMRQSQKMEAVGHLAGGVAHDFNNLLTVILGEIESLLEAEAGPESPRVAERREGMGRIQDAAERSAGLIRKLLAFSRRQLLRPQVLDVNAALAGLLEMLRRVVPEDIAIETQLDASAPALLADPVQLEQVILNLVVNARDAGARRIVLSTRTPPGLESSERVFLTISDDGAGMDAETQGRAFDPFFTSKMPGSGTGLGLSTVHGIVHQSGGSIELQSAVGRGTTVRVDLPRTHHAPGIPARERPAGRAGGSEVVLLVEDESIVRGLARRALEAAGFRVFEADDGVHALSLIGGIGSIELVVSDLVMPRMGGAELVDQLRLRNPDLAVLFISGYSAEADDLPVGADLLTKPFTGRQLVAAARRALDAGATT